MQKTGLYWLGNDLRRHDNYCLVQASETVEHLLIVFCIEPKWLGMGRYQQARMTQHRRKFLAQSLQQLKQQLSHEGQQLLIFAGDPLTVLPRLIAQYEVSQVFRSRHPAFDEQQQWQLLQASVNQASSSYSQIPSIEAIEWHELDNLSLINHHDMQALTGLDHLNGEDNDAPNDFIPSFSKFRRIIETAIKKQRLTLDSPVNSSAPLPKPVALSPSNYAQLAEIWVDDIEQALGITKLDCLNNSGNRPKHTSARQPINNESFDSSIISSNDNEAGFFGGERAANEHLNHYFSDQRAHQYKAVRNALGGWENSTKFSAWLANGSLSARQVIAALHTFERQHERSDSSYWIFFELLWREYFFWYAFYHQQALFRFSGIDRRRPLSSFYPERFKSWTDGTTPYPLVNACMKQLNQTGYMSNRGRQIVASCLVNELNVDWRYGAAYFEAQLIDYDVAINWGNWQYLAGVGADPRSTDQGGRHFDLKKQQQRFDPKGTFIRQWLGPEASIEHSHTSIDHIDPTGWPIQ